MLRLRCAVALARLTRSISRLFGRGGTALPGLVALRIDPGAIEKLVAGLRGGGVGGTGPNGKSTTAKMIRERFPASGRRVLANRTGSNLARGLAAELAGAWRRGRIAAALAVVGVDGG